MGRMKILAAFLLLVVWSLLTAIPVAWVVMLLWPSLPEGMTVDTIGFGPAIVLTFVARLLTAEVSASVTNEG